MFFFNINMTLEETHRIYQNDIWNLYKEINSNIYWIINYLNISNKM